MKIFFKINLLIWFYILKLKKLKVIHDLYSQCLTQTLSKMTFFSSMEGVLACWMHRPPAPVRYLPSRRGL